MNPMSIALALLNQKTEEVVGPKTNARSVAMLNPDMYQSSPDQGRVELANRRKLKSCWLPSKNKNNIYLKPFAQMDTTAKDGYRIFWGAEAVYVKDQYAERTYPAAAAPIEAVPEDRKQFLVFFTN